MVVYNESQKFGEANMIVRRIIYNGDDWAHHFCSVSLANQADRVNVRQY